MLNVNTGNVEGKVADKIRRLRKSKSLTLAQLAEHTGLSVALLSRIENNQSSPPIATLSRIAQGLGVSIASFFEEDDGGSRRCSLTRAADRQKVVRGGSRIGFSYQAVAGMAAPHVLETFVATYPKVDKVPDILFDHPGEELVFVLKGQIDFIFGQERMTLQTGDAVHFDPGEPHRAECSGSEDAHCLIVVVGEGGLVNRTTKPENPGGGK